MVLTVSAGPKIEAETSVDLNSSNAGQQITLVGIALQ